MTTMMLSAVLVYAPVAWRESSFYHRFCCRTGFSSTAVSGVASVSTGVSTGVQRFLL
jgi:hypothetical protein